MVERSAARARPACGYTPDVRLGRPDRVRLSVVLAAAAMVSQVAWIAWMGGREIGWSSAVAPTAFVLAAAMLLVGFRLAWWFALINECAMILQFTVFGTVQSSTGMMLLGLSFSAALLLSLPATRSYSRRRLFAT